MENFEKKDIEGIPVNRTVEGMMQALTAKTPEEARIKQLNGLSEAVGHLMDHVSFETRDEVALIISSNKKGLMGYATGPIPMIAFAISQALDKEDEIAEALKKGFMAHFEGKLRKGEL